MVPIVDIQKWDSTKCLVKHLHTSFPLNVICKQRHMIETCSPFVKFSCAGYGVYRIDSVGYNWKLKQYGNQGLVWVKSQLPKETKFVASHVSNLYCSPFQVNPLFLWVDKGIIHNIYKLYTSPSLQCTLLDWPLVSLGEQGRKIFFIVFPSHS